MLIPQPPSCAASHYHQSQMAFRDNLAKLRGLAGEKGCRLEKAPISGTWFLINEATGQLAISDKGTSAFTVERAVRFLSALSK
jgi:hypothetical protein